ncbi:putative transporter MCH1 [Whalleya microplaca]|nr:putative transporter MCH1 [Whalleya microplaca]
MTTASSDRPLAPLLRSPSSSTLGSPSSRSSRSSLSDVSPNLKLRRKTQALRTLAFVSSILAALCAGSITVFSLYGHLFQSRLHYTQFQINGIASAMSISMYIPVPVIGYMCDRVGPGPLSFLSAILLGGGYGLAAGLYQKGLAEASSTERGAKTTFPPMVFAFVAIGVGTAAMYLGAITTCAKNFGKGRYRGLMLVAPIASFGLSGMVLSQIGSRILYERQPDGGRGDVNVFHFFLFLCIVLAVVGLIGTFTLRIVDEQDLIDEAVEELERSGLLTGSEVFRRRIDRGYGAIDQATAEDEDADNMDPDKDDEDDDNAWLKKTWLLNAETRRFLSDHTMWWFAIGFWLIIGPGEAFINNMGTVIGTLYSPSTNANETSAATHVSIMATVSTVARLVAASLSDLLSPSPHSSHPQTGVHSPLPLLKQKLSVSRVTLFIFSAIILSIGTIVLASGAVQEHGGRFWIVSGSVGAGYGAVFSLTPIIITMIWGVENFGTNFGIVALTPALGSTMWGLIYSANYQAGAQNSPSLIDGADDDDVFCYGQQCYASTFWAMTVSIWIGALLVLWAWKGRDGWSKRGIVI